MFALCPIHNVDREEEMQRNREMGTVKRIRRLRSRKYLLVLSAGGILTAGPVAPTSKAANCNAGENGLNVGVYAVKSVLPFLGDRCVQIKPVEKKPTPLPNRNPSQHPKALSGDPR
jgi:hypothetical protein